MQAYVDNRSAEQCNTSVSGDYEYISRSTKFITFKIIGTMRSQRHNDVATCVIIVSVEFLTQFSLFQLKIKER